MALIRPYYLGCPMWSNKAWVGNLFTRGAKPAQFLAQYSRVLSTVEGNTTFYGVPSENTVRNWLAAAQPGFRFCFKFPRLISHDRGLCEATAETTAFFRRLEPLEALTGPFFLQLPPHFDDFDVLARYLRALPGDKRYAVELRHPSYFGNDDRERRLEDLLREEEMDRVAFDTRRLMAYRTDNPEVRDAQLRKPVAPPRIEPLGRHPFLRYVGYPTIADDHEAIAAWAAHVASWIREGRVPFVFMHQAPDDDLAPRLCVLFHEAVRAALGDLDPLPDFPGDLEEPEPEQLSLF